MNLRRVRIILTLLYGLLTALIVAGLATYAVRLGEDAIYANAERDAIDKVTEWGLDGEAEPPNTWQVNHADEWVNPAGDTTVEPPLYTLIRSVNYREGVDTFEQDGTWLAYVHPQNETTAVVSAVSLVEYDNDLASLRWRVWTASIGALLLALGVGWFVSGRAIAPARRAAQRQRDFIADAAHELRTPLATVQASASHALQRERSPEEYRQSLDEILHATTRAGSGVNELLEMARFESGQVTPRTAPLRLDLLTEEVAAGTRMDDVVIQAHPSMAIIVDADYTLLRQVVETLVRNAAARASSVLLSTTTVDREALLDVLDDGPGFDEELLPTVFDRFARGDTKGSSGLGLAIAKTIVDAHGGSITAENRPEGGALVRIRLPLPRT